MLVASFEKILLMLCWLLAHCSSCLPLRQGFLLPRSLLLMTPSLSKRKESLAEPPSRASPHCPPHLLLCTTTSWLLLLAVLWLPGHNDPVDGWLHPLCLGVKDDGGLAAVDLDSLPYLPHQGAFKCSCHLELEKISNSRLER